MEKDLAYYRSLPYTRRCKPEFDEEDGRYWVAWVDELPGCKTDGATRAEAMWRLGQLFDDYIAAKLEWGTNIPVPKRYQPLMEGKTKSEGTAD